MTRILRLGLHYWAALLPAIILMVFVGLFEAATVKLVEPLFDWVLKPNPPEGPILLGRIPVLDQPVYLNSFLPSAIQNVWAMMACAILLVFALKGLFDYAGNYLINYVGLSAITDLRQRVFSHVLRQDAHFFETQSTGRLMSSIMNDIEKIQVAVSHLLADLFRQAFTALALLTLLLQYDWKLALFSLTVLPFVFVPTARLGRRIRRTTRTAQDDQAQLNHVLQEAISGHQVVRSFSAEQHEAARFEQAAQQLRASNLRYVALQALPSPLIEFLGALTIVGLLWYGRTQILGGGLTTGKFTSFLLALLALYQPVKRLTGIYSIFQQATGSAQRVFEYLDMAPRVAEASNATKLAPFARQIEFDKVHFRYASSGEGQPDILKGISVTVQSGDILALVGPSGAGKTTLASLLPRFYDPTSGAIRLDGKDLREVTFDSLRQQIAIVAQDTFLFDDTVANNIRYGRQGASDEEVIRAAQAALADEFILRLPEGYQTRIGERGVKLSGGQRQRLAIARAILRNAPILILDEATSHLDTESESLVQRALSNLMAQRTVLVIAHRLSTIRKATRILVLDQGQILESGTHDELLERGGLYTRLYELQYLETDTILNP
jgi:ATP-binding cassette, subfamily B, bacterial MsbA